MKNVGVDATILRAMDIPVIAKTVAIGTRPTSLLSTVARYNEKLELKVYMLRLKI